MFARLTCSFAVLAASVLIVSPTLAVDRWPATRVGESESEQQIRDQLDQKTEFNFSQVPLADVISFLSTFHKIPIIVDRRAFANQQSDITQELVTLNLPNVSLRSALSIMLGELGLDYVIRDEVLLITSPEMARTSAPLCMFDVSSLAQTSNDFDLLLATVQSYADRYSVQISMYQNVMLVKGNQRQQDEIAAFLAALFKARANLQATPAAAVSP